MSTLVFGHKNPDTDSVVSAIATAELKNRLGVKSVPCVLGNVNRETEYVLNRFNIHKPKFIENVKTQAKDLNYDKIKGISPCTSILNAYRLMESENFRSLAVVDRSLKFQGIITMKDVAMGLIMGDFYHLHTSIDNIINDFNAKVLSSKTDVDINGRVSVIAYHRATISGSLSNDDIIIVGDRYKVIQDAIESKVQLIIVTGGLELPQKYIDLAEQHQVPMLSVAEDTYTVSKLINQCNYVTSIMKSSDIIKINIHDCLDDIKELIISTSYRNYPVVDSENTFLGFINKKHVINPDRKKVILVDHNEYHQSADGLDEADIVEIIDHHKIGDISTSKPISFRNMPLGSTCTIVYQMYKEMNMDINYEIAGILLAGIISDTLLFKSPTTTDFDKKAVAELNEILNLDIEQFAMDMFKSGTSLEGQSIEEIFYKDFKEFTLGGFSVGIAQVFTMDIEEVLSRKDAFLEFIAQTHRNKEYYLTLLVITDIIKEGSYLFYKSDYNHLVSMAFKTSVDQGAFVVGLVSRKKQVVPMLTETINMIK